MACVRRAWLVLGGLSVPLEDATKGYFCSELNLGYPEVREVVANRPDFDGVDDRTQYFGARVVSANITAVAGAGAQIDAVAAQFAPFLRPAARPVLHYILDRPGAPERIMTLRGSDYSWPVAGPSERDINLQWKAPDPNAYDPVQQTQTAWAGASTAPGRGYNLTFNRIYPPGGGGSTTAHFSSRGDLNAFPLFRMYGPVTGGEMRLQLSWPDTSWSLFHFAMKPTYTIDAGHWVDIDSKNHTVYRDSDRGQNLLSQVNWIWGSQWPYLAPSPAQVALWMVGSGTSGVTQIQAIWNDAFLT